MMRNFHRALWLAAGALLLPGASSCDESVNNGSVVVAVTSRASVGSTGAEGNDDSSGAAVSPDGRFVVFTSFSTTLVSNPVTSVANVYLRDLQTGTTELISVTPGGAGGNGSCSSPRVSSGGRYVVFASNATDLIAGLDDSTLDVFVRDRTLGTTARISQTAAGGIANGASGRPRMTSDGRFIVFESGATNLEGTVDTNGATDVFLWDRDSGLIERVSLRADGGIPTGASLNADVSLNGQYVVYQSSATDMVTGDGAAFADVFIRDRQLARTERVSVAFPSGDPNGHSTDPSISEDGRYVAFTSAGTNMTGITDVNSSTDVFVRDLSSLETILISRSSTGAPGFGVSSSAHISGNTSRVTFVSAAPNLVEGDTNAVNDVFVRDFSTGITQRASIRTFGVQASDFQDAEAPVISRDGRVVVFNTFSGDIVDGDTNGVNDVFVRSPLY